MNQEITRSPVSPVCDCFSMTAFFNDPAFCNSPRDSRRSKPTHGYIDMDS